MPGLGRRYHPEVERAAALHPLSAHRLATAPAVVKIADTRWGFHWPALNQYETGTCGGHAGKELLLAGPIPQGTPRSKPSAFDLYDLACRLDEFSDNDQDVARELGTSTNGVCRALAQLGECSEWDWAASVEEIIRFVAGVGPDRKHIGGPMLLGINWYTSMDAPDAEGIVRIAPAAAIRGGHLVCVRGWLQSRGLLICQQSWGEWGATDPRTGKRGVFYLPGEDVRRLLSEQGDAAAVRETRRA